VREGIGLRVSRLPFLVSPVTMLECSITSLIGTSV